MEEGLLSLKWNNHKSTFFQVLSGLREKHTYTDVTLACDGQVYPAHKFVLSTCSEYFSEIFTSTSGTSIVIVLKDVRRQDLEYLMDYMYLGQVDVAQSELPSLIKTAECLRIKGLAIPDDEPHKTQRRGADEREGSPPPSKKKRYLQEDDRHPASSTSTTNNNNNTTSTSSSSSSTSASGRIQMEVLPPPSDLSSLVHLRQPPHSQQPLQAPPPPPPTSQGSSKSHSSQSLSLNLTTQASRTPQGGSSGPHVHTPTSTSAPSSHRPHSSPSHTTPVPVIKEEAADPPETPEGYLNESFEENETKPDVSDPRHLDPDGAVPGPSGLQGSDNWDGDGEMGGYGGSDSYPEGSLEEHGESEVQGRAHATRGRGQKSSSSGGQDTFSTRAVLAVQPSQSQQSSQASDEQITEPLCVSLNPQHRARWCSGAAFSMVKQGKIMNIIPVYKTSWNKIFQGSNQKPGSGKRIQESMQSSKAPSGLQGKKKQEEGKRLSCKGHQGHQDRQEPQDPMLFGRLSYSQHGLEVNVTSYTSVHSTLEESTRNPSVPLSSSSSSSSSAKFSGGGELSALNQNIRLDVDFAPEVTEITDTQPLSLPLPKRLTASHHSPLLPSRVSPSQRPTPTSSQQSSSSSTLTVSPSPPPTSSLSLSVESRMSSPLTPQPPSPPQIHIIEILPGPQSPKTITSSQLPPLHPLPSLQPHISEIRTLPHKTPPPQLQVSQPCTPAEQEPRAHYLSTENIKKGIPVDFIASNVTVSTKGTSKVKTTVASQVKSCSVRVPRVLACHRCSLVLPDAKKLKKHIYSCQNLSRTDVKSIPDHNYYC